MHYTGTIWRPPYEADSLLLEVTAGYTHHKCKFCTLYSDLPFKFRMTPIEDIESDLLEVQVLRNNPASIITNKLQGLPRPKPIQRVFLTGANPFVLQTNSLKLQHSSESICHLSNQSAVLPVLQIQRIRRRKNCCNSGR